MKDNFPAPWFIACLKRIQNYNFVGMGFQRNDISKLEKENWKRKYVEIMIEFTVLNTALWVRLKLPFLFMEVVQIAYCAC